MKKRILITPLNWGLGHASRCIPIINHLRSKPDVEVYFASDGVALKLLQKEFPDLTSFELPSYKISYPTSNIMVNLALKTRTILSAIYQEQKFISDKVRQYQISGIISDNRFGCFHKDIPTAFMTHQLNVITPYGWTTRLAAKGNRHFIKKYDEVWIPDFEGPDNLTGTLSEGEKWADIQKTYLGVISRMKDMHQPKQYDIVAVLSGPEPQRTYLETKILRQMQDIPKTMLLVQGTPDKPITSTIPSNVTVKPFLASTELNKAMASTDLILTRTGYTTLMDLCFLQKKAIMVPTPGQTEQVYLGDRLMEQKRFYVMSQSNFDLQKALQEVPSYRGFSDIDGSDFLLKQTLDGFLARIEEREGMMV